MSKNWMMLTCILLLGFAGTSQAHPLDSPDIVYIDGLPCNSACQSYMAWSRQTLSKSAQSAPGSANASVRRTAAMHGERSKPAAQVQIVKRAVPLPPARTAALQPAGNAAAASEPARAGVAASPASDGAAAGSSSSARTIQEQVAAATSLAEHVTAATAAPAPQQNANSADVSGRSETVQPSGAEKTASASPDNAELLVAVLMAGPEIKSVSELTGKDIAIEDKQSASNGSVRTAIAAAGAAEVQLSESNTKPVDRLIGGEVPAAVLTLVSPEAAEWFPEIKGFKIFRIPLSPRSLKARL
jgi:hypothetical protein